MFILSNPFGSVNETGNRNSTQQPGTRYTAALWSPPDSNGLLINVESTDSESSASASAILVQHLKYVVRHNQHRTFPTMFAPGGA